MTQKPSTAPVEGISLPPRSALRFARSARVADDGEEVAIRDGRKLCLRSIAPDDIEAIRRCFTRLSSDEIRMRFLYHMRELPLPMARQLCHIDPDVEVANVLVDTTVEPEEIRGVGRIYIDRTTNQAEFAVLVEKAWTGYGLGALLMQRLVDACCARKVECLWGHVLIENRPMLDLCRALGFRRRNLPGDPGVSIIALALG